MPAAGRSPHNPTLLSGILYTKIKCFVGKALKPLLKKFRKSGALNESKYSSLNFIAPRYFFFSLTTCPFKIRNQSPKKFDDNII